MSTPSISFQGPSQGAAASIAPPPWSLMTPDARQPGQLSDAARPARVEGGAEGRAEGRADSAATLPRADDKPDVVRYDDIFGEDGFTFADALDAINPLQHLPIVSTVYRELTGDAISTGSRLAGGALFGGVVGLFSAVADTVVEESSGKDIGANAMAFLFGGEAPTEDAGTAVAAAPGGPPAQTQAGPPSPAQAATPAPAEAAPAAEQAKAQGQTQGPQVAALEPTSFFRSLQQPKSHELPAEAAQGAGPSGQGGAQGAAQGAAQQAALQAGKIQARTGTGTPQGAAGAIAPSAFIQPGARPAAAQAPASAPIGAPTGAPTNAPTAAPSQSAGRTPPAGGGPTHLSPAAANALMRMAEQSAGAAAGQPTQAAQPTPAPAAPAPAAAPEPAPGPSAAAPDLNQVPEAMMAALQKYEAMKRGE